MSREWCSHENLTSKKLERWYFWAKISRDGEPENFELQHVSGDDALAVHAMKASHKKPEYMWEPHRLAKHVAWLRMVMRQGMTEDEYMSWNQRELSL
jgi:hypothetical protein